MLAMHIEPSKPCRRKYYSDKPDPHRKRWRVWGHTYSLVVDSAEILQTNQNKLFNHKNCNITDYRMKMVHKLAAE